MTITSHFAPASIPQSTRDTRCLHFHDAEPSAGHSIPTVATLTRSSYLRQSHWGQDSPKDGTPASFPTWWRRRWKSWRRPQARVLCARSMARLSHVIVHPFRRTVGMAPALDAGSRPSSRSSAPVFSSVEACLGGTAATLLRRGGTRGPRACESLVTIHAHRSRCSLTAPTTKRARRLRRIGETEHLLGGCRRIRSTPRLPRHHSEDSSRRRSAFDSTATVLRNARRPHRRRGRSRS